MNPSANFLRRIVALQLLSLAAVIALVPARSDALGSYLQTNLVSDQAGVAKYLDADLQNAWGLASSPSSPWWVADNATSRSTIYDGDGVKQGLVVTMPTAFGPGNPTGVVFNPTSGFEINPGQKA